MALDCDRIKNEKQNLAVLGKTLINKRNHIANNQQNHVKIKKKRKKKFMYTEEKDRQNCKYNFNRRTINIRDRTSYYLLYYFPLV